MPDEERQAPYGQGVGERRDSEVDVVAPVELHAVRSVHLAPTRRAVGGEPEIGFVEVAEQQELADLPQR